jgi:hypothetical protein
VKVLRTKTIKLSFKQPNIKLVTLSKQFLGYLPSVFTLPGLFLLQVVSCTVLPITLACVDDPYNISIVKVLQTKIIFNILSQKQPNLKLETPPKQLLGYLPSVLYYPHCCCSGQQFLTVLPITFACGDNP